jgi:hypothetical protein
VDHHVDFSVEEDLRHVLDHLVDLLFDVGDLLFGGGAVPFLFAFVLELGDLKLLALAFEKA